MDSALPQNKQTVYKPTEKQEKLPLTAASIQEHPSLLHDTGQGDKTDEYDAWKTKRAD